MKNSKKQRELLTFIRLQKHDKFLNPNLLNLFVIFKLKYFLTIDFLQLKCLRPTRYMMNFNFFQFLLVLNFSSFCPLTIL